MRFFTASAAVIFSLQNLFSLRSKKRVSHVDGHIRPLVVAEGRRLEVGDVIHASIDLQFVVGRIETIDDGLIVKWETPLLIRRDTSPPVVITQLDSNLRIMGSATLYRCE